MVDDPPGPMSGVETEESREPSRASELPGTPAFRARRNLLVALAVLLGATLGIGAFTFQYAAGLSYFSPAPAACVNCHIMRPQYDGWQKASHHTVAVCIDCHLPHDFVPKYLAKAENGYRHSKEFTAGTFVEPIRVKPHGLAILQDNCVRCHAALSAEINHGELPEDRRLPCIHCHFGVGHGEPARLGGHLSEKEAETP